MSSPSKQTLSPASDNWKTPPTTPETVPPPTAPIGIKEHDYKIQHLQTSVENLFNLVSEKFPHIQLKQTTLETNQATFEANQAFLEENHANLEVSQATLEVNQTNLKANQATLEVKQTKLEADIATVKAILAEHATLFTQRSSVSSDNNTNADTGIDTSTPTAIETSEQTTLNPALQDNAKNPTAVKTTAQTPSKSDASPQISRDAESISLTITVLFTSNKSIKYTLIHHIPAAKCDSLYDLRHEIVTMCSEENAPLCNEIDLVRLIRDWTKVTFKLEEDGFAADHTWAPTTIDRACAFPESIYEAWFFRNVLRGNKAEYTVDVKIHMDA
ncbi:hypothetical protein LTR10_023659 [Elasticomyces elasticus]|uniref:Uncharacterized protein n=1 Tax=Exophiala sideris TaxID=1016849 RepID=A0ABR0JMK2_9EURO|nr:hypothetical protein LTR10_023659 [Elasticomyces elasticus]KAK5037702.1 hypothetical protein LTS07_001169 [Exophiala sideris]KAK5043684.1 hypothetical protein LTR13_000038 [Exophiala sideris]KAK5067183.1 hypothetical protein LTR69_001170 [Exophiala sideris]KAK5182516.1 hypothetical protein LTR44_004907 [Eurotiomycetes sp. CCFEE 6388]